MPREVEEPSSLFASQLLAFAVQVLDEIGCTLGSQLLDAPTGSTAAAPPVATRTAIATPAGDGLDGDLQSRLDALRRS